MISNRTSWFESFFMSGSPINVNLLFCLQDMSPVDIAIHESILSEHILNSKNIRS